MLVVFPCFPKTGKAGLLECRRESCVAAVGVCVTELAVRRVGDLDQRHVALSAESVDDLELLAAEVRLLAASLLVDGVVAPEATSIGADRRLLLALLAISVGAHQDTPQSEFVQCQWPCS